MKVKEQNEIVHKKLTEMAYQFAGIHGILKLSGAWWDYEATELGDDEVELILRCGLDEEGHSEKWYDTSTVNIKELLQ